MAPPRRMQTVILGDAGEELLRDIEIFFANREWCVVGVCPQWSQLHSVG